MASSINDALISWLPSNDEHQFSGHHQRSVTELSTLANALLCCGQAEEAREHCKACQIDVGEKRVEMANTKSDIITQIREMVSQCDLTLKAVRVDF